jgi:hypothetical protein
MSNFVIGSINRLYIGPGRQFVDKAQFWIMADTKCTFSRIKKLPADVFN